MSKTTHAELILHTLQYVTETLAEGDLHAVLDLGFRPDQVARLERFTLRDLHTISRMRTHFLDISVDALCFDRMLDHMEHNKDSEALQEELVRLRAPLAMMRAFFGMTNAEYAARRKLLGMSGAGVGRPQAPSEEEEQHIWHSWKEHVHLPPAECYLAIGRNTQIPLSIVWALIKSWEDAGLTAASAPGRARDNQTRNQLPAEGKPVEARHGSAG